MTAARAHCAPRSPPPASGDTINFSSKLKGETITLTSGELLITHSVTINGPGANQLSVSGNNASRVFELATGLNVTISGLTITHGYALEQGGGILNDGSNLTLSGDVLSQNVAIGSATDDFNGGAFGGALDSESGTLDITGCTISGNQALGGASAVGQGFGGGIEILAGSATVSDSTISGNLARGADNSSTGQGQSGAIDLEGGSLVVSNTIISGNLAVGGADTGGLSGDGLGGGITNFGPLTVTNSIFSGNSAVGGNGGTGEFSRPRRRRRHLQHLATASISGSTFDHNQASRRQWRDRASRRTDQRRRLTRLWRLRYHLRQHLRPEPSHRRQRRQQWCRQRGFLRGLRLRRRHYC